MLLVWLILLPFVGGVVCRLWRHRSPSVAFWTAVCTVGTTLTLSSCLWCAHSGRCIPAFSTEWDALWIPYFNARLHFVWDELSGSMLVLTQFLFLVALLCADLRTCGNGFYCGLLCLLGSVAGVFLSSDLLLFWCFWELTTIPLCVLFAAGGDDVRGNLRRCVHRLLVYAHVSGVLLLVSILTLVSAHHRSSSVWTFDYRTLVRTPMSPWTERCLMLGFFAAFAVKLPVVGAHDWFVDAHRCAPPHGAVDIAAMLLKTSVYGLCRFGASMFPRASSEFSEVFVCWGAVGMLYGALVCASQTHFKKLLAYLSVSHMGFLLVSIYGRPHSPHGIVAQTVGCGLSTAGLFAVCGQIHRHLRTLRSNDVTALWQQSRWLSGFLLFFVLSGLGLPGTLSFVAETAALFEVYLQHPVAASVLLLGLMLHAVQLMNLVKNICHRSAVPCARRFSIERRDAIAVLLLSGVLISFGMHPGRMGIDAPHETFRPSNRTGDFHP